MFEFNCLRCDDRDRPDCKALNFFIGLLKLSLKLELKTIINKTSISKKKVSFINI